MKESQIVKILTIFIFMKILIGDKHLGANDFFILSLDRNLLVRF